MAAAEGAAVSEERVARFVDRLLQNPKINLTFVPDGAERLLYDNVVRLVLATVEEILGTVRVDFLGHEIVLQMRPAPAAHGA